MSQFNQDRKSPVQSFALTRDLKEKFDEVCNKNAFNKSKIIARLIEDWLEDHGKSKKQ